MLIPYAIVDLATSPLCTCTGDNVGGAVTKVFSVHLFY